MLFVGSLVETCSRTSQNVFRGILWNVFFAQRPQDTAEPQLYSEKDASEAQLYSEANKSGPKQHPALNKNAGLYEAPPTNPAQNSSDDAGLSLNDLLQKGKESKKTLLNKLKAHWDLLADPLNLNALGLNLYAKKKPELTASSSKPLVGISSVFSNIHITGPKHEPKLQAKDLLVAPKAEEPAKAPANQND